MSTGALLLTACCAIPLLGQSTAGTWKLLFNGKSLDGWQTVGDGVWSVMEDGILVGDRMPKISKSQSWLYTNAEFREFDLELDYWLPLGGNSGVSIRDSSRGAKSIGGPGEDITPAHIGYEIQLHNAIGGTEKYPSGSVYLFHEARRGVQRRTGWNRLVIESRDQMIRVQLNGTWVSEHAGDPARPKAGPIGLQLHDPASVVMFRNIRIREHRAKGK